VAERTAARVPGRPREERIDQAVADATLELLDGGGIGAVTMESIAGRAGVGKAALYRRWPNKDALLIDVLALVTDTAQPQLGRADLRTDLVALLDTARRRHAATRVGRILPRLVGEAAAEPALAALYYDRVIKPRRQLFIDVLRAGQQRGDVDPGADLELVVDLLVGPVIYRLLVCPAARPALTRRDCERVVDAVLAGLTPR
jgi:AcrR family transcriptional regulator